jgi:hypothetical protein
VRIVSIQGEPISNVQEAVARLEDVTPGEEIEVGLLSPGGSRAIRAIPAKTLYSREEWTIIPLLSCGQSETGRYVGIGPFLPYRLYFFVWRERIQAQWESIPARPDEEETKLGSRLERELGWAFLYETVYYTCREDLQSGLYTSRLEILENFERLAKKPKIPLLKKMNIGSTYSWNGSTRQEAETQAKAEDKLEEEPGEEEAELQPEQESAPAPGAKKSPEGGSL